MSYFYHHYRLLLYHPFPFLYHPPALLHPLSFLPLEKQIRKILDKNRIVDLAIIEMCISFYNIIKV